MYPPTPFFSPAVSLPVFEKLFLEMLVPFYGNTSEFTQFVQLFLSSLLLPPFLPSFLTFPLPKIFIKSARGLRIQC